MSGREGSTVGSYELGRSLGNGYFGQVYHATNIHSHAAIALKIIEAPDRPSAERILQEARNLQTSANEHTVQINTATTFEDDQGLLVLIDMNYVRGGTVERLFRKREISTKDVFRVARHSLFGLESTHNAGVIHKDIKPSNILVDNNSFKIGDFGQSDNISKVGHPTAGYIKHTPPEHMPFHHLRDADAAVERNYDTYAVGITLFRLLSSNFNYDIPHEIISAWKLNSGGKTLVEAVGFEPYIPNKLRKLIVKSTSLDAKERFQTASEMLTALEAMRTKVSFILPMEGPNWTAQEGDKRHVLSVKRVGGSFQFVHKVNGRKRPNQNYPTTSREQAEKHRAKAAKSMMLR